MRAGADLENVFGREFEGARTTVASGLEVRVEPGDGVQVLDAAGYPLEHVGNAVVFRPGALFDGQRRTVWLTVAVPNGTTGEDAVGRVSVAFTAGGERVTLPLPGTFRVARVATEADMLGRVDVPAWTRGLVVDRYNQMQEEVARAVKAGEQGRALDAIAQFRNAAAPMNARVQSPAVQEKLEALRGLEGRVARGFVGPDQREQQNALSKDLSASALDERRVGSKR